MYAVTLTPFTDLKAGISRHAGEEFEVSEERFAEINAAGEEAMGAPLLKMAVKEPMSPAGKQAARKAVKAD